MDSAITFSTYEPISKYFNNKYLICLTFVTILLICTVVYYNPNINYLIIPSTFISKDVSSIVPTMGPIIYFIEGSTLSRHKLRFRALVC